MYRSGRSKPNFNETLNIKCEERSHLLYRDSPHRIIILPFKNLKYLLMILVSTYLLLSHAAAAAHSAASCSVVEMIQNTFGKNEGKREEEDEIRSATDNDTSSRVAVT
jgi:hypothetical protein